MPTLRIMLSAIQPAVHGATLSASADDPVLAVFWLPIEGADFKGRRFSTTLTHASCTIVGRKVDCSFRQPAVGLGKGAQLLRSDNFEAAMEAVAPT